MILSKEVQRSVFFLALIFFRRRILFELFPSLVTRRPQEVFKFIEIFSVQEAGAGRHRRGLRVEGALQLIDA